MKRLLPIGLVLALPVAGCARDTGSYPSLAPRAVEKLGFAEPDIPASVPATPDPALDARIAAWRRTLDSLASDFTAAADKAERSAGAARGAAVGSDRWLSAQVALATLDDRRARLSAFATELDDAASARAATLAPVYPSLGDLHDRTAAQARTEDATIARLQALLAPA